MVLIDLLKHLRLFYWLLNQICRHLWSSNHFIWLVYQNLMRFFIQELFVMAFPEKTFFQARKSLLLNNNLLENCFVLKMVAFLGLRITPGLDTLKFQYSLLLLLNILVNLAQWSLYLWNLVFWCSDNFVSLYHLLIEDLLLKVTELIFDTGKLFIILVYS